MISHVNADKRIREPTVSRSTGIQFRSGYGQPDIFIPLQRPNPAALKINCAQIGPNFGVLGRDKTRQKPRNPAIYREIPPMQNISPPHSLWNCWNSLAVMFELRCSKFELHCSESAGKPAGLGPDLMRTAAHHRACNWIQREAGHPVGPVRGLPQIANQQTEPYVGPLS